MKKTIKIISLVGLGGLALIKTAYADTVAFIPNPLSGVNSLTAFLELIVTALVRILMPFMIVMFVIVGLMFITARGNTTKLETAKKALLYVSIGAAIVLGAWVFAEAIQATINSIIGTTSMVEKFLNGRLLG